ncbi:MAG: hypothetical protein M0Z52_07415 [Actinomycetota bacterium]|nr:hypothetical protein [Actinomycetota bacterium]
MFQKGELLYVVSNGMQYAGKFDGRVEGHEAFYLKDPCYMIGVQNGKKVDFVFDKLKLPLIVIIGSAVAGSAETVKEWASKYTLAVSGLHLADKLPPSERN